MTTEREGGAVKLSEEERNFLKGSCCAAERIAAKWPGTDVALFAENFARGLRRRIAEAERAALERAP